MIIRKPNPKKTLLYNKKINTSNKTVLKNKQEHTHTHTHTHTQKKKGEKQEQGLSV